MDEVGEAQAIEVVAVTRNASLVIGLTFLGRDWEVASQDTLAGLPPCDVVVVDVGSTVDALSVLEDLDVEPRPPCVLIGDEAADIDDADTLLLRPFTLDELADAIDAATAPSDGGEAADLPAPEVALDPSGPDAEGSSLPETAPPSGATAERADDDRGALQTSDAVVAAPVERQAGGYAVLRGWAGRLSSKQADRAAAAARAADLDRSADEPADGDDDVTAQLTREPPLFAGIGEDVAADDGAATAVVIDLTAHDRSGPAQPPTVASPVPVVPPPLSRDTSVPPPPAPAPMPTPEPTPAAPGGSTQVLEQAGVDTVTSGRPARFSARKQELDESPEARVRRRLAEVVTAGSELEALVAEVPLLRSFPRLAAAIVHEIAGDLAADTAAFFERRDDGFHVVASTGLTRTEQRLVSPLDQPMLAEVHGSGGGLLIDPIDAAQAAVAGIGGAHTESFMAASVAAGPGRYGIVCVGRNEPLQPADLDALLELANEAAPGVAVSALLHRLSGLTIVPREPSVEEIAATSDSVWGGRHS